MNTSFLKLTALALAPAAMLAIAACNPPVQGTEDTTVGQGLIT